MAGIRNRLVLMFDVSIYIVDIFFFKDHSQVGQLVASPRRWDMVFYNRVPKAGSRSVADILKRLSVQNSFKFQSDLRKYKGNNYFKDPEALVKYSYHILFITYLNVFYSTHFSWCVSACVGGAYII